jgi:hypothetical protein
LRTIQNPSLPPPGFKFNLAPQDVKTSVSLTLKLPTAIGNQFPHFGELLMNSTIGKMENLVNGRITKPA